jgi:hypothetical protein
MLLWWLSTLREGQAGHLIGPPVDSRKITRPPDVRRELVDFPVDSDLVRIGAGVGDQRRPVLARLNDGAIAKGVELDTAVDLRIVAHAPVIVA